MTTVSQASPAMLIELWLSEQIEPRRWREILAERPDVAAAYAELQQARHVA